MTAHASGLDHYQRLFGQRGKSTFGLSTQRRGKLDRSSLPAPLRYLTAQGLLIGKPRGEWTTIRCPVHKGGDERKPSLRVSLIDGHFRCMACRASGGDIVSLHMLITDKRFPDAVADLGGRFHE
jgi:hypothetical protein